MKPDYEDDTESVSAWPAVLVCIAFWALVTGLVMLCTSCFSPRPSWSYGPNPLDEPGADSAITAETLHRKNIRWITKNPGYRLHEELTENEP